MRVVTFILSPSRGFLDPCEAAFRANDVVPRYVHDLDVLADESVVTSLEVVGSHDRIHESLTDGTDRIIDYDLVDAAGTVMLQIHYRPCTLVSDLLSIHRSYATLIEFPLTYLDADRTRLKHDLFGAQAEIQKQLAETRRRIDVTIRRVGAYEPALDRHARELTARQREVLETAVEEGYYEIPREATHEELAEELGCSASTVGKHLRRIEAAFASQIVSDRVPARSSELTVE